MGLGRGEFPALLRLEGVFHTLTGASMSTLRRAEHLMRSQLFGLPFMLSRALTRFDVVGREHLLAAMERNRQTGRGLITISNHLSLFDDPFVLAAMLGVKALNVESKRWYSTPCESNFSPRGKGLGPALVRAFSEVSKMVFFARPGKKIIEVPNGYADALERRGVKEVLDRARTMARAEGLDLEAYLERFVTPGDAGELAALNQAGMIEACARISCGDWLHFFPEGGRSRSIDLRPPRHGVGKVLYHCPDAEVVPFCFYGMEDVMPVNAKVPRPFQRVTVTIGHPISASKLRELRSHRPSRESYQALIETAWESVVSLRDCTLARHRGEEPVPATEQLEAALPATPLFAEPQRVVEPLPSAPPAVAPELPRRAALG